MSVETGAVNNGEPRWAIRQLQRWAGRGRNLDVIARAGRGPA